MIAVRYTYAGTKFALEAVSDALHREVEPLGVKVIVIKPGAVTTEMLGQVAANGERIVGAMTAGQRGRYATLMRAVISQAQAAIPKGMPAEEAGRVIADAITSKRPRTRYTVGRDAAIIIRLARFLSDRTLDGLLARSLKPHLQLAEPELGPNRMADDLSRKATSGVAGAS